MKALLRGRKPELAENGKENLEIEFLPIIEEMLEEILDFMAKNEAILSGTVNF